MPQPIVSVILQQIGPFRTKSAVKGRIKLVGQRFRHITGGRYSVTRQRLSGSVLALHIGLGPRRGGAVAGQFEIGHDGCRALVCFVYDPGRHLRNPAALENDLTDLSGKVPTIVIVAPSDCQIRGSRCCGFASWLVS